MKPKSLTGLVCLALMCLTANSMLAQPYAVVDTVGERYQRFASYCCPEKLFLHVDRTYYAVDETMYFMGYLDNATRMSLLPPSNFIYVELLDGKGLAAVRVKVKKSAGGGFPGQIYIPEDIATGTYTLRAYTVWQVNGDPEYMFHEEVRILGVGEPQRRQYTAEDDSIDVTFYPEGGRYYAGHRSSIAFKVMNPRGLSVEVPATLVDASGREVLRTATVHDGMGLLLFYPEEGMQYSLKVEGVGSWPLPAPSDEGLTMNVRKTPKYIYATIIGPATGTFCLFSRDASGISFLGKMRVSGDEKDVKISRDKFSPGINHLILTDALGNIMSERLLYSYEDPAAVPVCTFQTVERKYGPRELIKTVVGLADGNGAPLEGTFSMSVVRGAFSTFSQKDDIVSYMKLSSELRGRINDPGYYFDARIPSGERGSRLDLLMMIQGWRFYDLDGIFSPGAFAPSCKYAREYAQSITGTITNPYSEKIPHKFIFTVFSPKLHAVVAEDVEVSSAFALDSLDFGEGTGFFIKINRDHGVNNYHPEWDGDIFAPKYVYNNTVGRHYLSAPATEEIVPLIHDGSMVDTIETAVVTAVSEYDPYTDNTHGWEKNASDLKLYSEQTLIEYLQFKQPKFVYDGEGMTNTVAESSSFREGGSGFGKVKLIVDDIEEEWWMFDALKLEDIEKIAISSTPDTYYNSPGGIVSIKLLSGRTLNKMSKKDPTLAYFVPLGYQKPQKFYAPRYDKGDVYEGFDKRNTIFWRSSIATSGGKAGVFFSNTDQMDYPYVVHVEGMTRDGRYFSWHGKMISK